MNITAVVVTYNRLDLLKQCLQALKAQTAPLKKILVVDNCSTDGTDAYLAGTEGIEVVRTTHNSGGAGGFSEGIKQAVIRDNPDWIWLMDDDTIPHQDALEQLLPYTGQQEIGFVSSLAVWKDGTAHLMNKPEISGDQRMKARLFPDKSACRMIASTSFVSLLIRGNIPIEVGLPYKEFFIWADDVEYTRRITEQGYYGVFAPESVILHATESNYSPRLETIEAKHAWKLYYEKRNMSFIQRKKKNRLLFLISQLNRIRLHIRRIKKRKLPKEEEKALLKACVRGLWDGIFFSPEIEWIDKTSLCQNQR